MKAPIFITMKRWVVSGIIAMMVLVTSLSACTPEPSSDPTSKPYTEPLPATNTCTPGSGWMWTTGPNLPEIAAQVQDEFTRTGINATVEAWSFGEADSCGTFHLYAIDFKLTLTDSVIIDEITRQELANQVRPILVEFGKPNLGNISVTDSQGNIFSLNK